MKNTKTLTAALTALTFAFVACGEKKTAETADPHAGHDHAKGEHKEEVDPHAGHDHAKGEHKEEADPHAGHDHAKGEHKEAADDHSDHDHAKKTAGPNGGRIITVIEPHAEFWVTPERKVRITFLDDANKAIAVTEQSISVFCGNRNAPTQLSFTKEADGMSMLSTGMIPEGSSFDTNVSFKMTADAKRITAKFNLNMSDCPNCDYLEYACTCVH